ncbi:putative plant SNARE 11 [Hibiscus syriacus]|uniref:Plant SNARE 11 n=1 Tax=Hibiscus syriacus TaxID=106335 RepID=A0A6A3BAJ1_HIBSY|nr:putative plant SNARE 11 [Hibiscus syriacus]
MGNIAMTNHMLMDKGNQMMDETDQAIDRAKKVVQDTVDVGTDTAAALKANLKALRSINTIGYISQIATDKCIMTMLFLIVMGVITIIVVKVLLFFSCLLPPFITELKFLALVRKMEKSWDRKFVKLQSKKMIMNLSRLVNKFSQLVNPKNKDIPDIPGLTPPAMSRRLLGYPN